MKTVAYFPLVSNISNSIILFRYFPIERAKKKILTSLHIEFFKPPFFFLTEMRADIKIGESQRE